MRTKKERIKYIDVMRGFAIFLVVLGHVLERCGQAKGSLFHLIYSFHMPLFICISAYVSAYVYHNRLFTSNIDRIGGDKFLFHKFNAIMIPYFLWSLIVCPLFFNDYRHNINFDSIIESTFISNTSYWFLPCLFGLLVCYAAYKYIREKLRLNHILSEICVILTIFVILSVAYKLTEIDFLRSIISYYIPFWIGIFMGQYKRFYNLVTDNKAVFGICLITFCMVEGLFVGRMDAVIGKASRLVCGIAALPLIFHLFKNLNLPEKLSSFAIVTGQKTLGIYLIHSLFLRGMIQIAELNFLNQLIIFPAVTIFLIVLSLTIIHILGINPLVKKVLLG